MNETIPKIKVMISSTIKDLYPDRDAIVKVFEKYFFFVELLGIEPIGYSSTTRSPYIKTIGWAEQSDFFILLLGNRYGYEIKPGLSATEAEFNAAYKNDPTKIIIFKRADIEPDDKQKKFIERVSDYYKGFFITKYNYTHELQEKVKLSFLNQLKERMSIGFNLTYFDHFVRLAIQRRSSPDVQIYYAITDKDIILTYKYPNKERSIHFNKDTLYRDFWGCIAKLEDYFDKWRNDES